jgi:transcriptional regulator of acetoin/glycerol metabolism
MERAAEAAQSKPMVHPTRTATGRIWSSSPESGLPATLDPTHVDLIRESHDRCAALGLTRIDRPDHALLIRSDLAVARERNQRLSTHAAPVMEMLFDQIAGTESMIVLTDAQGTVLHAVGDDCFLERANKVALAPGANWAEQSKGTNAIGTALFEERPTLVHADQHFMHANSFLTCSAAPIFDPRGNVLGVLDVTGDHRSYHRHTMGLVRMSARMIENHWLADSCGDRLRLHFHSRIEFIGTLLEGILVVGPDGRILGANQSAQDMLGMSGVALRAHTLESLLGTTPAAVIDHFRAPMPMPMELALPDGRRLHFGARFHWTPRPVTAPVPAERPAAPPATAPHAPQLDALRTGDARIDAAVLKVRKVLDRDVALLLVGEPGTGKELLARAAHAASRRGARPFAAVHCAVQPPTLLEAELFGRSDGPLGETPGAIARAAGGTLFLDDVDALPPALQARLVAALAARRDDGRPRLDIALAAATTRELRDCIAAGGFREDLYFRLNGLALRLPPLRERSDLDALARRLLEADAPGAPPAIAPPALDLLRRHAWPGNVGQFASVLRTAALLAGEGGEIRVEHLPDDFAAEVAAPAAAPATLEEAEVDLIRRALDAANGNVSVASRRLGISRNTIYRKLRWKQPR